MNVRSVAALASTLLLALPAGRVAAQVPVGGFSSEKVEWVKNVVLSPLPSTVVGRRVGRHFFVLSADALRIFDVSKPLDPQLIGRLDRPSSPPLPAQVPDVDLEVGENLATNGKVLLLGNDIFPGNVANLLHVVDVRDKSQPHISGRVLLERGPYGPVCVLDCRWGYLAIDGSIIDLRNPRKPKLMQATWSKGLEFSNPPSQLPGAQAIANSLTEVAPGLVVTGTVPMYLLDVRRDPLHPKVLARSDASPQSYGTLAWPGAPNSEMVLSRSESFMPPHCELRDLLQGSSFDSAFKTWDASHWQTTGLITGLEEYYVDNGTYADGDPAVSGALPPAWGCGAGGFDPHPDFARNGLVVQAWHGHGTKFLKVTRGGEVEEAGWFLPYELHDTFGAYWISDDVVYTLDYPRGIDILRFDTQ